MMKEFFSKPELVLAPTPEQLALKLRLKQIKPADFLERFRELDQATSFHKGDAAALKILVSLEKNFEKSEEAFEYWNLRSLIEFHQGQTAGLAQLNEQALLGFRQSEQSGVRALEALKQDEESAHEYDATWVEYVRGTVSYFLKDLDALRAAEQKTDGENKRVLQRLRIGLETNNEVGYHRDY